MRALHRLIPNWQRPSYYRLGVAWVHAFRTLSTRAPGHTHVLGYDFVLLVPVFVDNVNPPRLERQNAFGIDIEAEYHRMLETICRAYEARWHL